MPAALPLPPEDMRALVGPRDPGHFDNPTGAAIYDDYGLPHTVYDAVFDFGCGCGRQARQLLQQTPRPRRYVGLDAHREMIDWCRANLTPIDPAFQFVHHNVYSPSYAYENSLRMAAPFPVEDHAFSLVLAHSVFTHLYQDQSDYYLHEVARILRPGGVAFTSWFFFDRRSFPFLPSNRFCLFINDEAPSEAVIYEREWVLEAVRRAGLSVMRTNTPAVAGHQWSVFLTPRSPGAVDHFPLGADSAEWLSGATFKPMAPPTPGYTSGLQLPTYSRGGSWPEPPPLPSVLRELEYLRTLKGGRLWLLARAIAARITR
jgi:SAM-dependent methyltransferase